MRKTRRAPRFWRHFRAWFGHYFWLDCDICGQPFGGHETPNGCLHDGDHHWTTCPDCIGDWVVVNGRYALYEWGPYGPAYVIASTDWNGLPKSTIRRVLGRAA